MYKTCEARYTYIIKERTMTTATFVKGQKVRNQYGKVLTVMAQNGCQVFVYENCGAWYHPSKLFAVK